MGEHLGQVALVVAVPVQLMEQRQPLARLTQVAVEAVAVQTLALPVTLPLAVQVLLSFLYHYGQSFLSLAV